MHVQTFILLRTESMILKKTTLSVAIAMALVSNAHAADYQFEEVEEANIIPDEVTASRTVTVDGVTYRLVYDELFRTGQIDPISNEMYGLMKDYTGNPAVVDPGSTEPYLCSGNYSGVRGSGTDFTALLEKNGKKYMITQFECQNGGMYTAELKQRSNGKLVPVDGTLQFVDNTSEWGGWVHCAGSVTPWDTYLGGEEYEPNANYIEQWIANNPGMPLDENDSGLKYYKDKVDAYWLGDLDKSSPYQNGWITEVDILPDGSPTYAKHYTMGRFSHELGYVMPDYRTVYLTDDGTNDTLFMFVANNPGDMSRGKLYAAKWKQTSGAGGGSARIRWIDLGVAGNWEIKSAIKNGIKFSDMFEQDGANCQWTGSNGVAECLEVKPGMDKLASRLESRRYAALMGATHEFRKMEGFTFDPTRQQAFIAISEAARAMLPATEVDPEKGTSYDDLGTGMVVTGDHIQLDQADYCGAIYSMDVKSGVKDTSGKRINSNYVTVNMNSILASGTPGGLISPSECAKDNSIMAQPDNITMIEGSDSLIIGEDGKHTNNMIWNLDLNTLQLTRILTVPEGAETTSPYMHELGGRDYMTVVTQHPDKNAKNAYGDSVTGVLRMK